ncbi:hypothetical protein [Planctomyces sp. SH-PL62]|uniref:hypothetical protein n=1 Tax=Planctomyces sp. SH-PL62 TaxID=1636152 RepID=UPI0012E8F88A|nr:hypothetical protein [Planctomyces sp. SH-PL62]
MSCMLAAFAAAGCGSGGSTSEAAAPRDEKSFGPSGAQHALGADPKEEVNRIKKAGAAAAAPTPGHLPGR